MWNDDELDSYQVYVLRVWRAWCQDQCEWRASIECPGTGERQSFANLDQLLIHLREQCKQQASDPSPLPGT